VSQRVVASIGQQGLIEHRLRLLVAARQSEQADQVSRYVPALIARVAFGQAGPSSAGQLDSAFDVCSALVGQRVGERETVHRGQGLGQRLGHGGKRAPVVRRERERLLGEPAVHVMVAEPVGAKG
jgi:hypothetical protein